MHKHKVYMKNSFSFNEFDTVFLVLEDIKTTKKKIINKYILDSKLIDI